MTNEIQLSESLALYHRTFRSQYQGQQGQISYCAGSETSEWDVPSYQDKSQQFFWKKEVVDPQDSL